MCHVSFGILPGSIPAFLTMNMIGYSKTQQLGKPVKQRKQTDKKVGAVDQWARERARLKVIYQSHGIISCEYIGKDDKRCGSIEYLSFAHIDKRRNLAPEELGSFHTTLLLCLDHHSKIENDREETDRLFTLLR